MHLCSPTPCFPWAPLFCPLRAPHWQALLKRPEKVLAYPEVLGSSRRHMAEVLSQMVCDRWLSNDHRLKLILQQSLGLGEVRLRQRLMACLSAAQLRETESGCLPACGSVYYACLGTCLFGQPASLSAC